MIAFGGGIEIGGGGLLIRSLNEGRQRPDVGLCHLQRLKLGQLVVVAERWNDLAQFFKGVVEAVHPTTLTRVGGQPSLAQYRRGRRPCGLFSASATFLFGRSQRWIRGWIGCSFLFGP